MTTNYKAGFIYNGYKPDNLTELLQLRNADGGAYTNFSCAAVNTNGNNINLGSGSIYGASIIQFGGTADAGQIDFNVTKGGQFTFTSDDQIWMNFTTGNKAQIQFDSNGSIACPTTGTVSAGAFSTGGTVYCSELRNQAGSGNVTCTVGLYISGYNANWTVSNSISGNGIYFGAGDGQIAGLSLRNEGGGKANVFWFNNINDTFIIEQGNGFASTYYGLLVSQRIGCGGEIDCYSDKRIKTNINAIEPNNALNILRKLEPKTYTYIEKVKNNHILNYGFIAQEVETVFPDCVSKKFEYIPNIADIGILKNKNIIYLTSKKTSEIILDDENTTLNIKVIVNGKEVFVILKEIIDEQTFSIVEPIEEEITDNTENKILINGQGINNFLSIEKNAIFTLTTAAVKQLDLELQETKETVIKQQKQIDSQKQQIDQLTADLAALKELIMGRCVNSLHSVGGCEYEDI